MPFEGLGPFHPRNDRTGQGTDNRAFELNPVADGTTQSQTVDFGSTTTDRWILVKPTLTLVTSPNQTTSPVGVAAQGFGWNFLASDFDATANLPANRRLGAGDLRWRFYTQASSADATYSNHQIAVNWYKRSTSGTYTYLIGGTTGTASPSLVAQLHEGTAALAAAQTFLPSETLHLEVWVRCRGVAITLQRITLLVGDPSGAPDPGGDAEITLQHPSGPGLRYAYTRTIPVATATLVAAETTQYRPAAKVATALLTATRGATAIVWAARVATVVAVAVFARRITTARSFSSLVTLVATRQPFRVNLRALAGIATLGAAMTRRTALAAKVATVILVPVFNRALTMFRSLASSIALVAIDTEQFRPAPKVATITPVAVYNRVLSLTRPFTSAVALFAARTSQYRPAAKVATAALGATFGRALTMSRSLASSVVLLATRQPFRVNLRTLGSTITPVAVFSRSFSLIRSHASSITLVATRTSQYRPTPKVATVSLGAAYDRALTMARSLLSSITPVAFMTRHTSLAPKTGAVTLVAAQPRFAISLVAKVASVLLIATQQPKVVVLAAKAATITLVASMTRLLGKNALATIALVAVYARAIIYGRSFTATVALVGRMLVQMPQVVLNRMTGGGGTTIIKKKRIYVIED